MNKLVSKNSVQRFKQGKKIIKADKGSTIATRQQAAAQGRFNRNYPYSRSSSRYEETSPQFPAIIQDARFGNYKDDWGEVSGLVLDLYNNNLEYQSPKVSVPYIPSNRQTQQNNTQTEVSNRSSTQQNNRQIEVSNNSSTNKTVSRKSQSNQKSNSPQLSFKDAFNRARNSGLKEFSWGGRRFNTQKKGEEGFIWSNGRWINPNIKFVVSPITNPTQEELDELDRNAKLRTDWQGSTFAKKGSKLIFRNPIKEFKRNFIQVAQ